MISASQHSQPIVLTAVQAPNAKTPPPWDMLASATTLPGFRFEIVPPGHGQLRAILTLRPRAVVVWVGQMAVNQAAEFIAHLLCRAPPGVVAISHRHTVFAESALRQAGAIYLCESEVPGSLRDLLIGMVGSARDAPGRGNIESEAIEIKGDTDVTQSKIHS
jgi:hypothetical protein